MTRSNPPKTVQRLNPLTGECASTAHAMSIAEVQSTSTQNEIGSTKGWAMFNVMLGAGMIRAAAANTTKIAGEVIPSDKPGCIALALGEPTWNAPVILGFRAIAVPLVCGNTVILKRSETCPPPDGLIVDTFAEAGFPEGVLNLVTNAP